MSVERPTPALDIGRKSHGRIDRFST